MNEFPALSSYWWDTSWARTVALQVLCLYISPSDRETQASKGWKKHRGKETHWWFALQSKVCSPCPGLQQRSWRDRLSLGSGRWPQQKSSWWWAVSGHAGRGGWRGSPPPDSRTPGSAEGSTWWWSWCQKPPQTADLWGKALHLKAQGYNSCQRESWAGGEITGFQGRKKKKRILLEQWLAQ